MPTNPLELKELTRVNDALTAIPDPLEAARATLRFAAERFGSWKIASSFSVEDVVLIDLAHQLLPAPPRVFTLDTGRLPEETYDVMDEVRARYALDLEVVFPDRVDVETLVRLHGPRGYRRSVEDRKACCAVRKVAPLQRALDGVEAWATGLRREQAVTRGALLPVELDAGNGGIAKVSPLFALSEDEVWGYVRANNLPFNALHAQGYPSIGCAPCTRAVKPGEDLRAGRWWWESPDTKECGLHVSSSSRGDSIPPATPRLGGPQRASSLRPARLSQDTLNSNVAKVS